jgi:hypothetical protein
MRLPSGIGLVFLAASLENQDQTIGRAGIGPAPVECMRGDV